MASLVEGLGVTTAPPIVERPEAPQTRIIGRKILPSTFSPTQERQAFLVFAAQAEIRWIFGVALDPEFKG